MLKEHVTEYGRKIAHLEQKLAKAENDTSLFDLKRETADDIVRVMTDATVISEHKASTIAKGILAAFKTRSKPAG